MKISRNSQSIEPSLSRRLFNMAKQYDDVIDLTLGDPDIKPSNIIRESGSEAIMSGNTKYSANAGVLELRKAISENIKEEYGVTINPESEITVTVGGMEALFLSISCLVDPGDEVIILAPYYVNYKQMVNMCSGTPVIINTSESSSFAVSAEQLEQAVTDRTVAIIINTPCNPTGTVLDSNALQIIAEISKKYDLTVISDEVYRTLIFDGKQHQSILTLPDMKERTVLIDSLSKRFAMTGYRLGYAVGPETFTSNLIKMQENVAACAPVPSQFAGIAAFKNCKNDTFIRDEFELRRNYIYDALNSVEGLSCVKPAATFYMFVNIESTGLDSLTFAERLLKEQHVAVVPGITYGQAYNNYVRIAFTVKIDLLKKAVAKIDEFMKQFR